MSDLNKLQERLIAGMPCRRVLGHGESCCEGYLCGACEIRKLAADAIEQLQARVRVIEKAAIVAKKKITYMLDHGEWYEPEKAIEAIDAAIYKHTSISELEAAQGAEEPFAYFQRNEGWNSWEEVIPSAAGQEGVVAAYRRPAPVRPARELTDAEIWETFEKARNGSDKPVGVLRGVRACLASAAPAKSDDARDAEYGNALPALVKGQSWCCENGCGDCTPVEALHEYSRCEDRFGNVVSKSEKVYVSHCCKSALLLWDEDKQTFVDWRYENAATQEQKGAQP